MRISTRTCQRTRIGCVAVMVLALGLISAVANHRASGSSGTDEAFGTLRTTASEVSSNWAGYALTGDSVTYTSATGTWREPKATCTADDAGTSSAFWVGIGGYNADSQALEQIGTSADCSSTNGQPSYYAWYELVPKASVTIKTLKVAPGDLITTSVNILNSTTIELQIKNRTRKTSYTTKLTDTAPDITSAEWIAEAPSSCDQYSCRPIQLTNFGSIAFTRIAAVGNDSGGTLTNPAWTANSIQLVSGNGHGFFPGPDAYANGASNSIAGATPQAVSTDGRSFTVAWTADATTDP